MLQVERTEGVHYLFEEGWEAVFLEPFWEEVFTAKWELVDVGVEEDVVDGNGRLTVWSHPLVRYYMYEKPSVFAGDGIVLNNLNTDWGFTVDGQQGDSNKREIAVPLDQSSLEAIFSDL